MVMRRAQMLGALGYTSLPTCHQVANAGWEASFLSRPFLPNLGYCYLRGAWETASA
jgi:hypothetical protein